MERIFEKVKDCRDCGLCETRKNVVFGEGNPDGRVMFIGEGPGEKEDETGRPFVGAAGQLLDKMLEAIDLSREKIYIANIVKCRPPRNRDPQPPEMEACRKFLEAQIERVRPRLIVPLGRIALHALVDESLSIGKTHGKIMYRNSRFYIPTYHPSALLRNPELKRDAWEDMKTIRLILDVLTGN